MSNRLSFNLIFCLGIEQSLRMPNQSIRVDEDNNRVVLVQKCRGEQGSLTGRIVKMQKSGALFPDFGLSFSHFFTELLQKSQ